MEADNKPKIPQFTCRLHDEDFLFAENLQKKLQEYAPEGKIIGKREVFEHMRDVYEKKTSSTAFDSVQEIEYLRQQITNLQTENANLNQTIQLQLNAGDGGASSSLDFSPAENEVIANISEKLEAHYGEKISIEDLLRLLWYANYIKPFLSKNKGLLTDSREQFVNVKF
jgi:hypothetical protein